MFKELSKKQIDYTGQKFGRLTFVGYIGRKKNKSTWLLRCDCGKEFEKPAREIVSGNTSSCGCMAKELRLKRFTRHGMHKTPLYQKYQDMIRRCYNPDTVRYECYGAKGVKVCKEWLKENNGFENFKSWAFENGYKEYDPNKTARKDVLTLDRIDNNGDYSPENCRWAKFKVQENNKSNNVYMWYKGTRYSLKELSERFDISYSIVQRKYHKGLSAEEIVQGYSRIPENYENRGRLGTLPNYLQKEFNLKAQQNTKVAHLLDIC